MNKFHIYKERWVPLPNSCLTHVLVYLEVCHGDCDKVPLHTLVMSRTRYTAVVSRRECVHLLVVTTTRCTLIFGEFCHVYLVVVTTTRCTPIFSELCCAHLVVVTTTSCT